jgi:hypothetical protein
MNVLDIYAHGVWWFEVSSEAELSQLREMARQKRPGSDRWHDGRAYYLGGDPATFNLKAGTFDEVRIVESGSERGRKGLERLARRWLTKDGVVKHGVAERGDSCALSTMAATGSPSLLEPLIKWDVAAESVLHTALPVLGSAGMF